MPTPGLAELHDEIVACRRCPRLVAWREEVAATRRAAFAGEEYWGRPLAGFGDPAARLVLVGLAPAAHGGNRTGRMFTGDRSGDFLYAGLYRAGYASCAESRALDDGLELRGAFMTAAVRCAPPQNRPTPQERDNCAPWLAAELALLGEAAVYLALGGFAYESLWRVLFPPPGRRPRPRFAHGLEVPLEGGRTVLCSYHPSQQNTFTGRLTAAMLDTVLARARQLATAGTGLSRS
ncbi:MAG TPA: uracil-DNA glycosylase [Acidimicrobiales bacterium]|nr:uracil-DNA glycosylase [Acidimicrobiales bacterium]